MFEEILSDTSTMKDKQYVVEQMYTERSKHEPTWRYLSKYIYPERGRFYEENGSLEGERRDLGLIDPYPMDAAQKCAAGLHSGLTSPSRPWFELTLADSEKADFHQVRMWLNEVHDIMMALYAKSNTYAMLYNVEAEISQFGTAGALMLQDFNTGIWHQCYTCGEYAGGVDGRGRVNSFARRFSLNSRQMVKEFGYDNVSEAVKNAYRSNDLTQRFDVEMLIEDNLDYNPDVLRPGNFPWRSFYWERGRTDRFLRISGYHEQPFLMPRWLVVANGVYGKGPGHNALGNCMQLQKIEQSKLRCIDNEGDPAYVFPASMKKVNKHPGAVNFVADGTQMQAYPLVPPGTKRYEGIMALVNEKRQQIGATFFNDLLVMLSSQTTPQMTAREVAERHEEKLLMLGPVLEQFHNEVLEPLTLRTFGIGLRSELFPPMPEEIRSDEIKVNFVSLLAQAQKQVAMPAVENVLGMVGNVYAVFPEAADNINIDNVIREVGNISGTPEKILRSEDEVKELREQRMQAQQEQAQQLQMQQAAQPAKDMAEAARVLSETPANGGNALDELIRGGGIL